ncbi:hypothetical protein [Mycolicibacterium nivoides]|uniref:Uncharacterized protein n=1 Tax=Mycolicibacterium nivoides TaxID=2487344 RepID=A0ABW9LAL2_9MYCO
MDDSTYDASPPGLAYMNFHAFMERILRLSSMARSGIGLTGGLGKILLKLASKDGKYTDQLAQIEELTEDPLIHSMAIMAAWGAFDAFIDDFCKGVMVIDPSILEDKDIRNKQIKVSHLLAPPEVKLELVYGAIKSSIDTRKIEERVEQTLGFFNLDTPETAPSITAAFIDSYKIRNVWAHSAGVADPKFAKEASHLGFKVGDEVRLTLDDTAHYLGAILYYGLAINNRLRLKHNLLPSAILTDALGAKLKQDFLDMYPQLPDEKREAGSFVGWRVETPEETEQIRRASEAASEAAGTTSGSAPVTPTPASSDLPTQA